jgi:uncharacterized protein (UPF0248 family)
MRKSRELLLRFYHDKEFRFDEVTICYVDRGAPNDTSCAPGERIKALGPGFIEIESETGITSIPYHRLLQIRYKGIPVWEK